MAKRFRRKQRLPLEPIETTIESLSQDGRGVCHIDGKATFIDGALPGERVRFQYTDCQRKHDEGKVLEVLDASPQRVEAGCAHFDICGGCSLQHLQPELQIDYKQKALIEGLKRLGNVVAENILPPLVDELWHYRRKARLGVKHVPAKGRVLVGFREKHNSYLADIRQCEVLDKRVGYQLEALSELVGSLDIRARLPQFEVAVTDNAVSLVVRHLEPLSCGDLDKLKAFGDEYDMQIFLQPKGPDTVTSLRSSVDSLYYEHPDYKVRIEVGPLDFYQVNSGINRRMVKRAIEHLELDFGHRVLDLFCGLGNFTLPIARHVSEVVGVEGDEPMVRRARQTALKNGIENTRYYVCNLMGELAEEPWIKERWDRVLLDPPRSGAFEAVKALGPMGVPKIVYISCHPGTLARDADVLVNEFGYRLTHAGVMDMFPHTAHVESFAVFERGKR